MLRNLGIVAEECAPRSLLIVSPELQNYDDLPYIEKRAAVYDHGGDPDVRLDVLDSRDHYFFLDDEGNDALD